MVSFVGLHTLSGCVMMLHNQHKVCMEPLINTNKHQY